MKARSLAQRQSLPLFPDQALREKALTVHRRLCAEYHCPIPWFQERDPLSTLVRALLSHRTRNADSGAAFRALGERFKDWAHVRDAPVEEVERTIAGVTWPEAKAPRIQAVLRRITELRRGELSLDFLAGMSVPAARAWLERIPGVGPKTSASVLLFSSLRRAALPVDSHHHRVAVRLGLVDASVPVDEAHAVLEGQLPASFTPQDVYDNHEVLMLHGQRCCFHANPACERCPVYDLCPYGQRRLAR